LYRTET